MGQKINIREIISKVIDEIFVKEQAGHNFANKIFYHGRKTARPYSGNYVFITDSLGYASGFSDGKILYLYKIPFPEDKLFSIKNRSNVEELKKYVDPYIIKQIIEESGIGNEMDWATLEYISTDDYEAPEDLLESLGFYGVKLKEREGINSVYVFNEKMLESLGTIDITTSKMIKKIGDFHTNFIKGKNLI